MFCAYCVFDELYNVDLTCIILQETTYTTGFVMKESFLLWRLIGM